jgi:hypothetical protein
MEQKKGRMSRVYTDGKKPAPESKIKGGGKMPERGERASKHMSTKKRMGG